MPLPSRGIVAFILGEHGPEDAGMLVGDGDQCLVVALAAIELDDPTRQPTGSRWLRVDRCLQGTSGTLNEQGAQLDIAAQPDPSESGLAAGAVLSRREAEPGAKLAPAPEDPGIGNRDCQRVGGDRANAQQFTHALRRRTVLGVSSDLCVAARKTDV